LTLRYSLLLSVWVDPSAEHKPSAYVLLQEEVNSHRLSLAEQTKRKETESEERTRIAEELAKLESKIMQGGVNVIYTDVCVYIYVYICVYIYINTDENCGGAS